MISSIAFSPDGQLLASSATGVEAGEVRIWNVATGQQISQPLPTDSTVSHLAFKSDNSGILADMGDVVWQWPGPSQWADLLCDKLSTNMSRRHWKLWVSPDIDYIAGCPDLPVPE